MANRYEKYLDNFAEIIKARTNRSEPYTNSSKRIMWPDDADSEEVAAFFRGELDDDSIDG